MSSILYFKDCPVALNGLTLFASKASISEKSDLQRRDDLGMSQTDGIRSRPAGSMTVSYYVDDVVDPQIRNMTGLVPITGVVGDVGFVSGFLTNYSISAQPSQLVQADVTIGFFTNLSHDIDIGDDPEAGIIFAHGGRSVASGLSFNTGLFSFQLDISQSISPYFKIGTNETCGFDRTDGSIKCSLKGSGLNDVLPSGFCDSGSGILLKLRTVCNDDLGDIEVQGMRITDAKMSVDSAEEIVGELNLVKFF